MKNKRLRQFIAVLLVIALSVGSVILNPNINTSIGFAQSKDDDFADNWDTDAEPFEEIKVITDNPLYICNHTEHTHTQECLIIVESYEYSCDLDDINTIIHSHDKYCYDSNGNLVCSLQEISEHTHDSDCFSVEKVLACNETVPRADGPNFEPLAQNKDSMLLDTFLNHVEPQTIFDIIGINSPTSNEHIHSLNCFRERLICGIEEHNHNESCVMLDQTCGIDEHTHDDFCYVKELICNENVSDDLTVNVDDSDIHHHDDSCYLRKLVCNKVEHQHSDNCYSDKYICNLEEHVHSLENGCYESVLMCEMELDSSEKVEPPIEDIHENADQYISSEGPAKHHVHNDDCYEEFEVLVCSLVETDGYIVHQHSDECATVVNNEIKLCELEEHTHTIECINIDILSQTNTDSIYVILHDIDWDETENNPIQEFRLNPSDLLGTSEDNELEGYNGKQDSKVVLLNDVESDVSEFTVATVSDLSSNSSAEDNILIDSIVPNFDSVSDILEATYGDNVFTDLIWYTESGDLYDYHELYNLNEVQVLNLYTHSYKLALDLGDSSWNREFIKREGFSFSQEEFDFVLEDDDEEEYLSLLYFDFTDEDTGAPLDLITLVNMGLDRNYFAKIEFGIDLYSTDIGIGCYLWLDNDLYLVGNIRNERFDGDEDWTYNLYSLDELKNIYGSFFIEDNENEFPVFISSSFSSEGLQSIRVCDEYQEIDGLQYVPVNLRQTCIIYAPFNVFAPKVQIVSEANRNSLIAQNSFYTFEVYDEIGSTSKYITDRSCVDVLPNGSNYRKELPLRSNFLWIVEDNTSNVTRHSDEATFIETFETQSIKSPVKINCVLKSDAVTASIILQQYCYTTTVKTYNSLVNASGAALTQTYENSTTAAKVGRLFVIDQSRSLPKNNVMPDLRYIQVTNNKIETVDKLEKLYHDYDFLAASVVDAEDLYMHREDDVGYVTLSEVWVFKGSNPADAQGTSKDTKLWDIYSGSGLDTLLFDVTGADNTITIDNNTIIRLVTRSVSNGNSLPTFESPASLFDYDIGNGYIYTTKSTETTYRRDTSAWTESGTWYMYTNLQGINSSTNYSGSGSKFGFGNGMPTGLADNTFNDNGNAVIFNRFNSANKHWGGVSFGLVTGITEVKGIKIPIFNSKISAPNLFGPASEGYKNGRSDYNNFKLNFIRDGDTYTLTSANLGNKQVLSSLETLKVPYSKYSHILTNNFFPLDGSASHGTKNHDMKWGPYSTKDRRVAFSSSSKFESLSASDDYVNYHNAYFGMSYEVEFDVSADYCGPLEYYFFGDDDLWVFLDGHLVIDIGGVHSSVGAYTDLWKAIAPGGKETHTEDTTHTLTVFYTERGASGSTCWMNFRLPHPLRAIDIATGEYYEEEVKTGSIQVQKDVFGEITDESFEFEVEFKQDGETLIGPFPATCNDGTFILTNVNNKFSLKDGEFIVIDDLPLGSVYTVKELDSKGYVSVATGNVGIVTEEPSIVQFINSMSINEFSFTKLSTKDNEPIEGAQFGLYSDYECTNLIQTSVSDSNGSVVFSDSWSDGDLYLKELTAPAGHVQNDTVYRVNVTDGIAVLYHDVDGYSEVTDIIYNEFIEEPWMAFPDTGGTGTLSVYLIGGSLIMAGICLSLIMRKPTYYRSRLL